MRSASCRSCLWPRSDGAGASFRLSLQQAADVCLGAAAKTEQRTMAAPPLLFLKDIDLSFGGPPLLAGAGLSIGPGERLCLVGRNGSGKSTLLKIAAGMIEPDCGRRFVPPQVTIRYFPHRPALTVFDTAGAFVEAGLAPGDDPHRARYLLESLGLTGEEEPARLSGGESRRA